MRNSMMAGRPRMAHKKRMVPLIVMVPPMWKRWMEDMADREGKSLSEVVRDILGRGLPQ
jgi:hypothetical protein